MAQRLGGVLRAAASKKALEPKSRRASGGRFAPRLPSAPTRTSPASPPRPSSTRLGPDATSAPSSGAAQAASGGLSGAPPRPQTKAWPAAPARSALGSPPPRLAALRPRVWLRESGPAGRKVSPAAAEAPL